MFRKRGVLICGLVLTGVAFFGLIFAFPLIMNALTWEAVPLAPKVTYHEFPIYIEYRVGGEQKVIDDVLICRFEGYDRKSWLYRINAGGEPFSAIWSSELKNHTEDMVLFSDEEITIEFSLGSPAYYMGDTEQFVTYSAFRVWDNENAYGEKVVIKFLQEPKELEAYGIIIVSCVLPEPIENSFD